MIHPTSLTPPTTLTLFYFLLSQYSHNSSFLLSLYSFIFIHISLISCSFYYQISLLIHLTIKQLNFLHEVFDRSQNEVVIKIIDAVFICWKKKSFELLSWIHVNPINLNCWCWARAYSLGVGCKSQKGCPLVLKIDSFFKPFLTTIENKKKTNPSFNSSNITNSKQLPVHNFCPKQKFEFTNLQKTNKNYLKNKRIQTRWSFEFKALSVVNE